VVVDRVVFNWIINSIVSCGGVQITWEIIETILAKNRLFLGDTLFVSSVSVQIGLYSTFGKRI